MFYAILTTAGKGTPFKIMDAPPSAPGDPLRVSPDATLVAFERQPDRVFANQYARASGQILWYVNEEILHRDDMPADETFSSYHDFQVWLSRRDTK